MCGAAFRKRPYFNDVRYRTRASRSAGVSGIRGIIVLAFYACGLFSHFAMYSGVLGNPS